MTLQWAQKEQMPHSFLVDNPAKNSPTAEKQGCCLKLSDEMARGRVDMQALSAGLYLTQSELLFAKDTSFHEKYPERNVLQLSFCLGGSCTWNYRDEGKETHCISPTQLSLQCGVLSHCDSYYPAGQAFRTLGISVDVERFPDLTDYLEAAHLMRSGQRICTSVFASTPRARLILQQLANCPPALHLKRLYLEGKALELLSVFCTEVVGTNRSGHDISKEDYRCLCQARAAIDERFLHPLTIAQIAAASYLSETKLKQGFKTCFGCTVYEYIVEKRMEMAHTLLHAQKYKVKDVAWMVGYTNVSHFIDAFRNRYGMTPGDVC